LDVRQKHGEAIQNPQCGDPMGVRVGSELYVHTVSNRIFPSNDTYVQDLTAPADIIGMSGAVIDGVR
jgi:hypothetical protein